MVKIIQTINYIKYSSHVKHTCDICFIYFCSEANVFLKQKNIKNKTKHEEVNRLPKRESCLHTTNCLYGWTTTFVFQCILKFHL